MSSAPWAILGSRARREMFQNPPSHSLGCAASAAPRGGAWVFSQRPPANVLHVAGAPSFVLVLLFKTFGPGSLDLQSLSSGSLRNRLGVPPKSWFNISFLDCFLGGLNRDWTLGEVTAFVKRAFFHNRRSLFGFGLVFPHSRIPRLGSVWPCVRWSLRATTHFWVLKRDCLIPCAFWVSLSAYAWGLGGGAP